MNPTLLLILDGFGIAPDSAVNAISLANVPVLHKLLALKEGVQLEASGRAVGLPSGFIGNSEVGHLNIGAGTVVYQDMTKIDVAIEDSSFYTNTVLLDLLEKTKKAGGRVHFLGLLSDGGVHSHVNHLKALLETAQKHDVQAYVHAFLDGRDVSPTSGKQYVENLLPVLTKTSSKLATLCGRFYAMDRDNRWERVQEAWDLLVHGKGLPASDPVSSLKEAYTKGEADEFIKPRLVDASGLIQDNDSIFFFNFRADRAKELALAFSQEDFNSFDRGQTPVLSAIASMTAYDAKLTFPIAYPKDNLQNTLGERVSQMGLRQLRIAETEKYAHVTYFFNGGRETPFDNEERILIPSPKEVATYDLKPQMSAFEVTDKLIAAIHSKKFDFIVCNLANPDMVGHTGIMSAAIQALEAIEICVNKILTAIAEEDWRLIITSDHGNIEEMLDAEGNPQTAHTMNRTPLILIQGNTPIPLDSKKYTKLADIASLILA